MARPWRIEYEGAYYHVFSRGNEGKERFFYQFTMQDVTPDTYTSHTWMRCGDRILTGAADHRQFTVVAVLEGGHRAYLID